MPKSSVRTKEVFVMKMEEWAQVVITFINLMIKFIHSNTIGISCMTKKAHFQLRKEVRALCLKTQEIVLTV